MSSMNISIRDEVYDELKRRRGEGESFSDVIERLMRKPAKLSDFAGLWAGMGQAERREMKRARTRRQKMDADRAARLRARLGE